MSINTKVYVGVYVDLLKLNPNFDPYDDKWDEFMLEYNADGFVIIYDGMSGGYCYFGKTLFEFDDLYSYVKYEINQDKYFEDARMVEVKAHELFNISFKEEISPKLTVFSHCD